MPISLNFVVRSTLALLAVGFVALLFSVLATTWLSESAQRHAADVKQARELHSAATVLRDSLLTAESSQRGYILTGNQIYLAPYDNAKLVANTELARLNKLLAVRPDRQNLLQQLSIVVAEKTVEQDKTIALRDAGSETEAFELIRSNRGKALMDEANVYLSSIALEADQRLSSGVAQQTSSTHWLRWTSIASAVVIVLVVGTGLTTLQRFTREIMAARDEVRLANETLEMRVERRTAELARARDRAEVLLAEVNHRVSNSLGLVSSLVRLQSRELQEPAAKAALQETNARIQAIAELHKHLFTTGNVGEVAADTYLATLLSQLESAMAANGSSVTLTRQLAPITLATNDAINLGIVVTEWVTNAFKYAYPTGHGEVRVSMAKAANGVEITVEDDGVGKIEDQQAKGTGLGTRVVSTIAGQMSASVAYRPRERGTEACLTLPYDHSAPELPARSA